VTIVAFNYQTWALAFPEFIPTVTEPMAQRFFATACLYINNTDSSPISADPPMVVRPLILDLATAHVAKLFQGTNTDPASGLVGRLSQAAEGSVNVSVELEPGAEPSRAWWVQTPYGFAVWQATAPYRVGIYIPNPPQQDSFGAGPPGFLRGW
jgi:hypothetical protein